MGKITSGGTEQATKVVSGTFTATGQSGLAVMQPNGESAPANFRGRFNISLFGTFVGIIALERSFDAGVTYSTVSEDSSGTDAIYTAPVNLVVNEPEAGVLYRWNCTAYTSGTINYRISQ